MWTLYTRKAGSKGSQREVHAFYLLSSRHPAEKNKKRKDLTKSIRPSQISGRANSVLWFFAYANLMVQKGLFFNELTSGEKHRLKGYSQCCGEITYRIYD